MDEKVGVYRDAQGLGAALGEVRELRDRMRRIHLDDRSWVYNTDLTTAVELQNLLDLAELVIMGALARTESRGGHARRDYPDRDDERWLAHSLMTHSEKGPLLAYAPVKITIWKPVERKY